MKNILIIDDNPDFISVVKDYCQSKFKIENMVSSNDCFDGYLQLSIKKYDIIFLDNNMPYVNGTTLVEALKKKKGLNASTPIVMISGGSLDADVWKSKAFDDVLILDKVIDFEKLDRYLKMFKLAA